MQMEDLHLKSLEIVRCLDIRKVTINASMGELEISSQDVHQASVPLNDPSTRYPAASKDLQEFLHEENQKKQKLCLAQAEGLKEKKRKKENNEKREKRKI